MPLLIKFHLNFLKVCHWCWEKVGIVDKEFCFEWQTYLLMIINWLE
jgi:hypothetical protein